MKFVPNENLLRVCLLVFNIFFGILSITLITLGIIYIDEVWWPRKYIAMDFVELPTLLIILGSFSLFMAILGCICAKSYNRKLFIIFIIILIILLGLELTVAIISFENMEGLQDEQKKLMELNKNDESFHILEQHYNCCGVNGTEEKCQKNETQPELEKVFSTDSCLVLINDTVRTIAVRVASISTGLLIFQCIEIGCSYAIYILMKP